MKKVFGLDIGTTSIGWAVVEEAEKEAEKSKIIRAGVRLVLLTSDENAVLEKGKKYSINAERTLKRGIRRSLDRYKQRRKALIKTLRANNILTEKTLLTSEGKNSHHAIWGHRSKAATEKIALDDFVRILFAINKKRGYKSNRKIKNEDEGQVIDGMEIAIKLHEENLTPGQYTHRLLQQNKKHVPEFYQSDLQKEFNHIWDFQKQFYSEQLTDELKKELKGKNKQTIWKKCKKPFKLVGEKRIGKVADQKVENYSWRTKGLEEKLTLEQLTVVLQEISGQINNSSNLLGEISNRSKELYFQQMTIGQYLYQQIKEDPHIQLKKQTFYRQDYIDEFEKIWNTQAEYYPQLTHELKEKIKDMIIFYQRRLKSQKGLISICELEGKKVKIDKVDKIIGPRVIPKSSPLFQEFKIWQTLNNLKFESTKTKEKIKIAEKDQDMKLRNSIFEKLNIKEKLSENEILKMTFDNPKEWKFNFKNGIIKGNTTNDSLYKAYQKILELFGHGAVKSKENLKEIFSKTGINPEILDFNSELEGKAFEKQLSYQLWHLLYAYEGDDTKTANNTLFKHLKEKFGFEKECAKILNSVVFQQKNYGSLSAKAIKKILPYMKKGHEYSEACRRAGYNHSHSLTKEENKQRKLSKTLELLPKNSLRNPVVEKILNQMVHVVNAIINEYGKPDEIRIELARELKKNTEERQKSTKEIDNATKENEKIKLELESIYPFKDGVRITKNDIIKYKLWQELASNEHKTIYTHTYISKESLFTKSFDIEHIIPKAHLLDNSFSNKTIATKDFNLYKGNKTGIEAIIDKYGENSEEYKRYTDTIEKLYKDKKISKAKHKKFMMNKADIPDGFINRDLKNSQYIAKKARQMLLEIVRQVTPVTGTVTHKLRQDWQLINVLRELNWDKYQKVGLTESQTNKNNQQIPVILDWDKRNDHRHHAMDALTIAFTKHSHIQYFNYLNARKNEKHKEHHNIYTIEEKETFLHENKRLVTPPMPIDKLRGEVKKHLESILISFKSKNKVITPNKNYLKDSKNPQTTLTPRGQLHKESIYGKRNSFRQELEKVNTKFDREKIARVSKKSHREALLKRLESYNNDPKKAFGGPQSINKKPIYLNKAHTAKLPEQIMVMYEQVQYTLRKEIDKDLNVGKVVDKEAKQVLEKRLNDHGGKHKDAFVNLEQKPIWINKNKGLKMKRVTIGEKADAMDSLHYKKDHHGTEILDGNGKKIPVDFVSTRNNHHVAIYEDEHGNLQEKITSFFEAVIRKNQKLPVILIRHPEHPEWKLQFTMKKNEMFVFPNPATGFDPNEIDLLNEENQALISPNLFRVQKISSKDYNFLHHLETSVTQHSKTQNITWKRIQSMIKLKGFEAVIRKNQKLPVILIRHPEHPEWKLQFTMKENEMFVFPNPTTGFDPNEIDLLNEENQDLISPNLFGVQNISSKDYNFLHHLKTSVTQHSKTQNITWKRITSMLKLKGVIKVRINHLGKIVQTGEY